MRKLRVFSWAFGGVMTLAGVTLFGALGSAGCGASASNVPIRTFERAQRVDVVCMHVVDANFNSIAPVPLPEDNCAPVPEDVDGTTLPNHLYALVTQTARGQVAVVDLTVGEVVDINHVNPGIDFLPVGALPTDVAVTPDGQFAFVPTAELYKPAIYTIPSTQMLGDSLRLPGVGVNPPQLTSWAACGLPQAPGQMSVVTRTDGTYELALVLPGDGVSPAKLVTVNPTPLENGTIPAGSLAPCVITGTVVLGSGTAATTTTSPQGPAWSDGIVWLDGGAPPEAVPPVAACTGTASTGTTTDGGAAGTGPIGGSASDAGLAAAGDGGAVSTVGATLTGTAAAPHATALARVGTTLYIGDDALPLIHVIDVSVPGAPRELLPLSVTSQLDPTRSVGIKDLSVSPTTSMFQRFLYAVDARDGSVLVYDVTDPVNSPHAPLTRPHPELNPFMPPDRLTFAAPVAAVTFVQHDRFLQELSDSQQRVAFLSGLICNPNPNAGPSSGLTLSTDNPVQLGAYYRADVSVTSAEGTDILLGPTRLRGIFGFVTLTNGSVIAIDVDDWDGPCRRPDFKRPDGDPNQPNSSVSPQEPAASGPTDLDPYHVPVAFEGSPNTTGLSPTTLESFFPVSAPHRARSGFYLRNDPTSGTHQPYINGVPELFQQSAPLPTNGPSASQYPLILPTTTTFVDPTYISTPPDPNPMSQSFLPSPSDDPGADGGTIDTPAVRLSWETPDVQTDQDWSVTYEGQLPGFTNLQFTISPGAADDSTAILAVPHTNYATVDADGGARGGPLFCRLGVEDARQGAARAAAVSSALTQVRLPQDPRLASYTGDYIEVTDDILNEDDPYWSEDNECWAPDQTPDTRWNTCSIFYGLAQDESVQRDFPILEAYDDHLVIGRYNYPNGQTPSTANRGITQADPGNAAFLRQMRCCFHDQVHMAVRAGGEWLTTGSVTGYLHRMTADPTTNACVQGCDPREALLASRSFQIPRLPEGTAAPAIDRNSVLALRNPMFSFLLWAGRLADGTIAPTTRDDFWRFSTRGQYTPLNVNIAATNSSVDPQSMHFIESLGLLAVVDGAQQGLVLIDLNTIALAHDPFF